MRVLTIQIPKERLCQIIYDSGVRHGIDLAQGRPDKLVAKNGMSDPEEIRKVTMQKEVMGIKPELVASVLFKSEYKPYKLGLNNDSPDLALPDEVCEWFSLPSGSMMEVKGRPNRMLYFPKPPHFPHENAQIIALFTDNGNWTNDTLEFDGVITREKAMEVYKANPDGHTIDFKRGLGVQPFWRANELFMPELPIFELNRLMTQGFKAKYEEVET